MSDQPHQDVTLQEIQFDLAALNIEPDLTLELPLIYDELKGQQLGSTEYRNTTKQEHEPRESISAYESRRFFFQIQYAQARYGTYKSHPACLIVLNLSFQKKVALGFATRFQMAEVDIQFRDAPVPSTLETADPNDSDEDEGDADLQPTIQNFEPRLFVGPASIEKGTSSFSSQLMFAPHTESLKLGGSLSFSRPFVKEGSFTAHGTVRDNPPSRLRLTLSENTLTKSGIREEVSVAVIVKYVPGRRFSALITVRADVTGRLTMPVCGEKDEPVYFDPEYMIKAEKKLAEQISKSSDPQEGEIKQVSGVSEPNLEDVELLQQLTRLGQYGGYFVREMAAVE